MGTAPSRLSVKDCFVPLRTEFGFGELERLVGRIKDTEVSFALSKEGLSRLIGVGQSGDAALGEWCRQFSENADGPALVDGLEFMYYS